MSGKNRTKITIDSAMSSLGSKDLIEFGVTRVPVTSQVTD